MIDNESFKTNEYNNFDEVKIFKCEQYGAIENLSFKENDTFKEENRGLKNKNKDDYKSKDDRIKKKVTNVLKEQITHITSSISSIVTTATFVVVASVVTVTTFLSPVPIVSNVVLSPGNDYLMYSFNIEQIDDTSNYFLEVSNLNYNYSIELDMEETGDTLSGYVYNLKPNHEYDFKLLKDNGEVGGYSDFYSESFYTLKVPKPSAQVDVNYSNNKLNFKTRISDYYSLCSNTYLQYTVCDDLMETISFDNNFLDYTLTNDNYKSVTFEIYSTIYEENTLLASYTYDFSYYEVYVGDNIINIIGNAGDEYSLFTDFKVLVTTYNRNNEVIENIEKEVMVDGDKLLNVSFDYNSNPVYFTYSVLCNNYFIYSSSSIELIPVYTFDNYEMTSDGLLVTIPEILSTDNVTITYNNMKIPVETMDKQIIIPMNVPYDSFNITINEYDFILDPGELYFIKNIEMYNVNNSTYFLVEGFVSTVNNSIMDINYSIDGTIIDTFSIGCNEQKTFTSNSFVEGNNLVIECLLKNNDEQYGQENISCDVKDNIVTSFELGETNLQVHMDADSSYDTEILFYDEEDNIINSVNVDFENYDGIVNWIDCFYVKCKMSINGFDIYLNEKINKINSTITSTKISNNSKYLYYYTTNLTPDMSAYILDKNDAKINGTIHGEFIEFYIYDDSSYTLFEIQDYDIYLSNDYDSKKILVTLNVDLQISDIGLEYYSYGYNGLIFTAAYLSESNYELVVDAIIDGTVVKSESYDPSEMNKTIYALNNFNNNENMEQDTKFEIYLLDENEVLIGDKYTYIVTKEMKTVTDYVFHTPNISDILVTYNEDLINLYIPTEFNKLNNPDLISRIILKNDNNKMIFESNDPVVVIENIPNDYYSVTYQLVKKGTNINMLLLDVTVSGSVNSGIYISPLVISEIVDDETYFWIDISGYINMSFDENKTGIYDHDECYFDSNTNRLRIKANSLDEITLFIFTGGNTFQDIYDNILSIDPNVNISQMYGKSYDVDITLPEIIRFTSDTTTIEELTTGIKIKNSMITSSDYISVYINEYDVVSVEALDGEFTIPLYNDNNEEYNYTEYLVSINSVLYLFKK